MNTKRTTKKVSRRRGRPPKGEYADTRAALTARVTTELRAALDRAAGENDRSLSQEIEHRLRSTFAAGLPGGSGNVIADTYGGRETYALMLVVAQLAKSVAFLTQKSWIEDRFAFEVMRTALAEVVAQMAPEGEPEISGSDKEALDVKPKLIGEMVASGMLATLGLDGLEAEGAAVGGEGDADAPRHEHVRVALEAFLKGQEGAVWIDS